MILLNGHSLTVVRKVPLDAMSLQIGERDSSASIVPADMTGIGVNSWLKDDTDPGAGIVWRVKSIRQAYDTNTPTVQLEHVINTLADRILFGEITPATITGSSAATTCTAQQAINYILNQQSDWVLYSFDYGSVSNPYKFDGDTLLDALETVSNSLEDAWWSYDMSVYPFRLNITQKQSGVGSILRPGRNLQTISKTIDKSGMYTRFYPIGKDDLHIDTDYIEKNASTYGVISRVETDSSIDSKAELTRWANERLNRHAEPTVTIDVEGLELADATGETLDRMTLGRICAVPLPEYGTTIQERIIQLNYSDKIHQPKNVKVTMANKRTDVQKIIADSLKKTGSSGRSSARQAKEDHAFMEDMDDSIGMVVGYTDETGKFIKAGEISLAINTTTGESLATINASHVNISATTDVYTLAGDLEHDASGKLVIKNAGGMYVRRTESGVVSEYGVWDEGNLTGGVVVSKVNGETTTKIKGTHVAIGDSDTSSVTVSSVFTIDNDGALVVQRAAVFGTGQNLISLNNGTAQANTFAVKSGGTLRFIGSQTGEYYDITAVSIQNYIKNASVDGNTLKLWKVSDGTNPSITFSKATSLSGAWSGSVLTVTASPQGNTYTLGFGGSYGSHNTEMEITTNGAASKSSTAGAVDIPIKASSLNSGQTAPTARYTKTLTASISNILQSKSVTSNGTVTPDSGYIGLTSVDVQVPSTSNGVVDLYPNGDSDISTSASMPTGSTNLSKLANKINNNVGNRLYVNFWTAVKVNGSVVTSTRKQYSLAIN